MKTNNNKAILKLKAMLQPYRIIVDRIVCLPKDFVNVRLIEYRIRKKVISKKSVNVVFVLQYPEMWNSQKSVYEAFLNDERFKTYVLTIPKPKGVGRGLEEFEETNVASAFCLSNKIEYVEARKNAAWIDINTELSPDIVFIQRPYDSHMPPIYSLKNLSTRSILSYIPYGYEYVDNIHLDIEYNRNFMNSVFCCFAENATTYAYISKRSRLDVLFRIRRVFNLGYPRFDLIITKVENDETRSNVLWTPRWSLEEENDRSHFFDYFELLFNYFLEHPEMHLVIRPHPLMFKNFIDSGVLSTEEYIQIKEKVERITNIEWDINYDYLKTFSESDLLISDFSTLVIEFFIMNKPVIYCGGNTDSFNEIGEKMAEGLYKVDNGVELLSCLNFLANNPDKFFERNRRIINSDLKVSTNIGFAIKEAIAETYLKV